MHLGQIFFWWFLDELLILLLLIDCLNLVVLIAEFRQVELDLVNFTEHARNFGFSIFNSHLGRTVLNKKVCSLYDTHLCLFADMLPCTYRRTVLMILDLTVALFLYLFHLSWSGCLEWSRVHMSSCLMVMFFANWNPCLLIFLWLTSSSVINKVYLFDFGDQTGLVIGAVNRERLSSWYFGDYWPLMGCAFHRIFLNFCPMRLHLSLDLLVKVQDCSIEHWSWPAMILLLHLLLELLLKQFQALLVLAL